MIDAPTVPATVTRIEDPEQRYDAFREWKRQGGGEPIWKPNPDHDDGTPNPQRMALESEADELYFGGQAGGGKTDLVIGAALTQHRRAAIFRRVSPNLDAIEQRMLEIVERDNYNLSRHIYDDGQHRIELESCQHEKDKEDQRGRPRDLHAFDEITEFTRTQYLFIIGWNRTTVPGQRARVIVTGNAPMDEAGEWVTTEWGPWIDPEHPHRAEPGELRWYYYDDDGNPVWMDKSRTVTILGKEITPKSRTFIPASLDDNPHYGDDYLARIMSMPEPLRSSMLGDFQAAKRRDPWQVIPAAWVRAAQRRWMEREEPDMPLSGVGVDLVRGGKDSFALARRRGTYFLPVVKIPGVDVEDGPAAAGLVHDELQDESDIGYVNVDIVGIGSSGYDSLKGIPRYEDIVFGVNAGAGSDYVARDKDGNSIYAMRNVRAEYYWRMREDLDPEHGNDLALPPGNELLADLCAAKYKLMAGNPPKVQIEAKEDIKKRLGRSPDEGEAVMLSNFPGGRGRISFNDISGLGTIDDYQHWTA